MDPDVTYTKLTEAIEQATREEDNGDYWVGQIVEHWEALDGWLKMGGHAPKRWDMRMRSRGR